MNPEALTDLISLPLPRPQTIRYQGFDSREKRWYAVRTSFRHEKRAQQDLERQGLDAWLPLLRETRRYNRKYREVEIPLLGSYLFVHINAQGYYPVVQSHYINGFVRFGDHILPIPDVEIALIRRIVGDTKVLESTQREMEAGDVVEIIGGKLTGVRGVLEGRRNRKRVSVSLTNLGYVLVIEVDPSLLRRIA
jgi:transcription antitermination factor NusG